MVVKKVTGSQGWLADNINNGRLDCFYALLTILGLVNFVAFLMCARGFKPRKLPKPTLQMGSVSNANGHAEDKC